MNNYGRTRQKLDTEAQLSTNPSYYYMTLDDLVTL